MITAYKHSQQHKKMKEVQGFPALCWINVLNPTAKEIRKINRKLKLPMEVIQDSIDQFELPRIKIVGNKLVVILRTAVKKGSKYKTIPVTLIVNHENIITISPDKADFLNDFIDQKVEIYTTKRANFLINACLRVVYYYQKYITELHKSVQAERANITKITKANILKLVETEETLNDLIASLDPTIGVIKKLMQHSYIDFYPQDKELIDDLLVDGEQVLGLCRTNLKTIHNIREGYSTVMSMSLNQIMKILTYITAIFTIPMIVVGAFGMNVRLPFADMPAAFGIISIITGFLMVLAVLAFIMFRKKM